MKKGNINLNKITFSIQKIDLGVYVNKNGKRSRNEEIMWPSKPLHVAYLEPYLLSFSDRGTDVFHSKTGEWVQILQFPKVIKLFE